MDLGTKILIYSRWVINESSNPVDEIEWLVSDLLDTEKKEEIRQILDIVIKHNNLT